MEPQAKRELTTENLGKPHDHSAEDLLPELISDLREALLVEANRVSSGAYITDDDLNQAYKRLNYPNKDSLEFADAQAVISQALHENKIYELLAYVMTAALFLFGLVLLSIAVLSGDVPTRVGALCSGSVAEILILMPFRYVINSRRQNIALRMLGLILNRVDDPKKMAPLLKDTFLAVVLGKAQFRVMK